MTTTPRQGDDRRPRTGPRRRAPGSREAGFSLIEVLVAAALFLILAVGILPLFFRSLLNNVSGNEATQMSRHASSETEDLIQTAFNNWELAVTAGSERVTQAHWLPSETDHLGDELWVAGPAPSVSAALWERSTTVRQYQINEVQDLDGDGTLDVLGGLEDADGDGIFDNPLPSGAPPGTVHLKEVLVVLDSRRETGALGAAMDLTLRTLKSF